MATLVTIGEIIKKFRTEGACIKFSPKTILHMADVIGYHKQRSGGKVGYEKSLITAISQRIREAIEYENSLKEKKSQRVSKQLQTKTRELDYVGYNGERDNVDYEWEKNENKHMKNNIKIIKEDSNVMTGLWLDDSRKDPVAFLNKANDKSESGAVVRDWYNKNMNGVNIQWTAVTNYWQFKDYILKNGVPDFVSLDHDLGKDPQTGALKKSGQYYPTGTDCAMFLASYCLRKHIPLPKHYIHSANDNQRVYISKVFRLAKMGKDPLEGVDLNNDEEIGKAADNFRHGIMGTKEMVKQGQLGTADRLARIKGIKDPNDLFRKKKDIYREDKQYKRNTNMNKKLIRLTESDLHRIVKESVNRILKEVNYADNYRIHPNEKIDDNDDFFDSDEDREEFERQVKRHGYDKPY